ncbi:SDR family NAD(P)-dependent oxidoreductase [Chloroflexota bacterium]
MTDGIPNTYRGWIKEMQTIAELFDLAGKSALITGGAVGIGQAIAFRLAEAGANVMISDINTEGAEQTVNQIKAQGGKAQAIHANASVPDDATKMVQATVTAFGHLDILVNNAGLYPLMPFMQVSEELWDTVLDLNLKGTFLCSQTAAKEMINQGTGGNIINLSSIDGIHPSGSAAYYSASKGGIIMLTKALALELAPHKILVNAVAPGSIITPGTDAVREGLSNTLGIPPQAILDGFMPRVPLQRMGEPDDIARVVLFLASAASDYITGDVIVADGGFLLS